MRLTDEQKESLAKAAGVDLVDAIVACILRLDEAVAAWERAPWS